VITDYEPWLIDVLPQPQPENLREISKEELREYLRCAQQFVEPRE